MNENYIEIPFHAEMQRAVFLGKKSCTSRNRRYGKVGDIFRIGTMRYKLTGVMSRELEFVANKLYEQEGFSSPEAFITFWGMLHPTKLYDPDQKVWVHFFERVVERR